ncbi:MAG: hypothetical protein JXA35_11700 [Deltaproteobacteria bacterium]|nr:hypothetical protein [Deltaproteobacteria bacterium]
MKLKNVIFLIVCLFITGLVHVMSHIAVKQERRDTEIQYQLNPSPVPPDFIRLFSFGFDGIMADHLILKVASFIGRNQPVSSREWDEITLIFEQCLSLDPYFEQTYLLAQGLLPWEAKRPENAVSLLDISRKHRPWDWRPGYYLGFNFYYFLQDYAKASEAFLEAAKIKGAPVLLAVLGGRFAAKGGRTQAAIVLLKSMLNDPDIDEYREKEISDRIDALKGIMLLESAIKKYQEIYSEFPESLEALIEKGMLDSLPANPYADRYFYSPGDGRVFFDMVR